MIRQLHFLRLATLLAATVFLFQGNLQAQVTYRAEQPTIEICGVGISIAPDLSLTIESGFDWDNISANLLMGDPVFRKGGKTAKNLTPRESDTDGLSVTTTKPTKGWELPSIDDLEDLGFEVEPKPTDDDPNHHVIRPGQDLIDQGHTLEDWIDGRDGIDEDDESTWPHLTKLLHGKATPIK